MNYQLSFLFVIVLMFAPFVNAQNEVDLYLFFANTCPHCAAEIQFLNSINDKYPELEIRAYEVTGNKDNAILMAAMCEAYGTKPRGVPITFIGDDYMSGFGAPLELELENKIQNCIKEGCIDPGIKIGLVQKKQEVVIKDEQQAAEIAKSSNVVQTLLEEEGIIEPLVEYQDGSYLVTWNYNKKSVIVYVNRTTGKITQVLQKGLTTTNVETEKEQEIGDRPEFVEEDKPEVMHIPVLGKVDTSKFGLPLFTITLGILDGFNPCAIWVLCFLLTLLIHAQSRKKMLLIGSIFVFTSGFVYFLFMTAWLNFFLFIGFVDILRIIIALVAVLAGLINTKDFFFFKRGISLTIPESAKPKLFEKMRVLVHESTIPAVILGTIVLAFTANTFELLCTAGFPAIYTRVLTLRSLPTMSYYMYLILYNIIYVVPLAIIVGVFVFTMGAHRFTERQGRWLKLIGGILMLVLGLLLLIRPELLTFG